MMKRALLVAVPLGFGGGLQVRRQKTGAGPVADGGIVTTTPAIDAGAATPTADISQCAGCAARGDAVVDNFSGIYSDDKCTAPLAQIDVSGLRARSRPSARRA